VNKCCPVFTFRIIHNSILQLRKVSAEFQHFINKTLAADEKSPFEKSVAVNSNVHENVKRCQKGITLFFTVFYK
jgi:hypothetical protein